MRRDSHHPHPHSPPRLQEVRVLFVFDPWRSAILLVAGDKAGNWTAWYDEAVPPAERMGVTKGRVSQIESGQVSGTDVVARYVEALGGNLVMVAVFGDGELRKVG
ncbi:type II toxin-antitoxin system RelE/ParE family toxin [Streptomyces europaeiscabiei]|uniref:type II toxin-antitoxin system RelE/ParE family toxin n=1 Tax=Streptomyces europaeiscabiei TaxID=146819 RepID=UPI0038F75729